MGAPRLRLLAMVIAPSGIARRCALWELLAALVPGWILFSVSTSNLALVCRAQFRVRVTCVKMTTDNQTHSVGRVVSTLSTEMDGMVGVKLIWPMMAHSALACLVFGVWPLLLFSSQNAWSYSEGSLLKHDLGGLLLHDLQCDRLLGFLSTTTRMA